ncbi:hypothetical protein JAAARDRAFT_63593 [Jaapia argillacea MUCL 33604]|uniref:Uncharacterized protein n=1 Tax=Jaapia argillacea MUCL 33604 TaxID=933084 RepID=A0A067PGN9_9AGAM|nr:hypothetical protein JAAARDRAFT_63593 [Jaapia argillacea MUCL 33604]
MYTPAQPNVHESLVKGNRILRTCQKKWENTSATEVEEKLQARAYRMALDELERLVVQRLFELSKLNVSGTGYKLRTQISKALQRRSDTIRRALQKYNLHAGKVTPPRPQLRWKEIVEYSFLGEFDLLRHSRNDIREEKWAQPAYREATVKYLQLQRAHEEIQRLNIEMRRLRTAIHDEGQHTMAVIQQLQSANAPLAAEVERRWALRAAVNMLHIARLDCIESTTGFSGTLDRWRRRWNS